MRDQADITVGREILGGRGGRPAVAGFSLIELLVVIGLIAFLAGSLGLGLRRPGGGVALQAGQATLAAVCRAARVRAAATGDEVRLVVAVDPMDPASRLRYLQVVHEDPANPDHWLAEGAGFWLPPGVYVVPPQADAVPGDAAWPETRCSTALTPTAQALIINGAAASLFYSVPFTARGTTRAGTVLVTGGSVEATADGASLRFGHPDDVRGVRLRASGALTLLAGAGALDP